jgi:hypothetical protein
MNCIGYRASSGRILSGFVTVLSRYLPGDRKSHKHSARIASLGQELHSKDTECCTDCSTLWIRTTVK